MTKEYGSKVWIIMLVLSIFLLMFTIPLLLLSGGQVILEQGLKYAGSPPHWAPIFLAAPRDLKSGNPDALGTSPG